MKNYQRILVAIDVYSEYDQVLKKALSVVKDPSHLYIVFVTLPTTYFQPYISAVGGDYVADIHNQAKHRLDDIGKNNNIPIKQLYLPTGNAAEEIHTLANEINADLIVIGTHGRSGIKLLLGSTANSVLHGAKQDVLAIRII
jgi:universal stress protein A